MLIKLLKSVYVFHLGKRNYLNSSNIICLLYFDQLFYPKPFGADMIECLLFFSVRFFVFDFVSVVDFNPKPLPDLISLHLSVGSQFVSEEYSFTH